MGIPLAIIWGMVALSLADSALETNKLAEQHFEKAIELLKRGKYEMAIDEYEKVMELVPRSRIAQDAQYWIGQCYFRAGKFDEALSIFERLIEEYPGSAIVPVTRLMMARVRQEKENRRLRAKGDAASDKGIIVDPKTGLKFIKILSDERLNPLSHNLGLTISPDGRFLFDYLEHWVIPLEEGEEPFSLAPDIIGRIWGSWSPDMSNFAFTSDQTGELCVIPISPKTGRPDGSTKKLVEGSEDEKVTGFPSWSPDGKRIAFSWRRKGNLDVWTIPVKGGEPTRITNDPRSEGAPLWSPDGKSIVFARKCDFTQDRTWDIWVTPAEGETAQKLLEDAFPAEGFSPDGKLLAFIREGVKGVGILRLSDKRQFHIAPPKEVVGEFSYGPKFTWSPEGNKLLFYNSGFEYWSTLRVVLVYGGPSVELGNGVRFSAWTQSWSPDGKVIVTLDWETKDLWIVPTDGGTPVKLKVETEPKIWRYAFLPFSPDLKKLAFLDEDRSLWVVPISIERGEATGPAVKIAEEIDMKTKGSVGWSPDSKRIAFSSLKGGNADIWVASTEGDELERLTYSPEDETISGWSALSAWSPDGKMILYRRAKGFWMVSASGGKPRELIKDAGERVWSPDGREIAFLKSDYSSISTVTLTTGEVRGIVDLRALGLVDPENPFSSCWGLTWSPDGRWLSFITLRNRTSSHLWVVPAEGGRPMELAGDDPGKWFQYWSPDARRLSFNSDRDVRVRMGAIWEVDVGKLVSKGAEKQGSAGE
jgi:Tol biopolymer transport system component/Tfp pilus assembly protein PilF